MKKLLFPESPVIKKTINYGLFKNIKWNRSIDNSNLEKLLKENSKNFKLHEFPILVTKEFKIIDGQHRFAVAKEIGSPVYYIVSNSDDSFESVHSVNKAGKKHTIGEKLEMLYRSGDKAVKNVYAVSKEFDSKFPVSIVAQVLAIGNTGGEVISSIDSIGSLQLRNYEKGIEVLKALYASNLPDRFKPKIIYSLCSISRISGVPPVQIVKRIEQNLVKWIDPKSRPEAVRVMLNCYNYGLTIKNRIVLDEK